MEILYNNYRVCDDPDCKDHMMDQWGKAGNHLHFIGDVAKPKGHFVSQSGERDRKILIRADLVNEEYFKERLERQRNGR